MNARFCVLSKACALSGLNGGWESKQGVWCHFTAQAILGLKNSLDNLLNASSPDPSTPPQWTRDISKGRHKKQNTSAYSDLIMHELENGISKFALVLHKTQNTAPIFARASFVKEALVSQNGMELCRLTVFIYHHHGISWSLFGG